MAWNVLMAATPPAGSYINAWKLLPVVILLPIWVRLLTWVDKDTLSAHLPREQLNTGLFAGLILAFALFFLLPAPFIVSVLILFFFMAIEAGAYLAMRNAKVGLKDLKGEIKGAMKGMKKDSAVAEVAGEVQIVGKSGSLLPAPATESPEAASYLALQSLFTDPLRKGATQIDLAPVEGNMAVRYVVDNYAYRGASIDKAAGSEVISYLKRNTGLDVNDRRKPQSGAIKLLASGKRREFQISTRGTTAGETLTLRVESKQRHNIKLDDLGFSPVQLDLLKATIGGNAGIVLVAAPKGMGLTTLLYGIIRAHDAFLTHIHTIERDAQLDLEGITQNKLTPNATGAEEAKLVRWVMDQQPDTILVSSLEDTQSARDLIKFAKEGKRVYIGMRAGSTQDALDQWRKLVGDDKLALDQLVLVIAGRVLRKLCNACKVGYAPDPGTLRKLNMNPDRVSKLYQARTQPIKDPKGNTILCEFCHELHFLGQTGIFELFMIDEDAKAAVMGGASPTQLKMAFRKQRAKYMQELALQLVEKGDTSVQEVLRVMRPEGEATAPLAGARPPTAAPRRTPTK